MSSSPSQDRPLIIGGGISGLAAAYYLAKRGRASVLFEAGRVGGVIQTKRLADCVLEEGPDSFLSAKPEAQELIGELGLGEDVIGSNDAQRATWIWRDGKMIPLPDGLMMMVPTKVLPLATSPLLSWGTKVRMGLEWFQAPRRNAPDRSVGEFIEAHYGKEAVEYLAEPLLSGVYGGDPYRLSVESVLPRFAEMERNYGSLTKGTLAGIAKAPKAKAGATLFRTLKGGLGSMIEALQKAIAGHCEVIPEQVRNLRHQQNAGREFYTVETAAGQWQSREVVLATPAWAAGQLLGGMDAMLSDVLAGIGYSSSLTVGLVYERTSLGRQFPAFGFLVPGKERQRLVACTFVDQKFNHRVPADKLLLRCFLGGAGQEEVVDWTDEAVIAAVCEDLRRMLGIEQAPVATSVSRWPRSMAQYEVGHANKLEIIEERLKAWPGLRLIGNGYRGIGIPDCIRLGKEAAASL
ncbi:MAG: protoporphyrinogen oxidase [Bryobacter sp.]|nr:protoporphyrinogen oxidase [Bryobacter sp.]